MPLLPFGSAPQIHPVPISQGGTGSATQNFVDLTQPQVVGGVKTFGNNQVFQNSSTNSSTTLYIKAGSSSGNEANLLMYGYNASNSGDFFQLGIRSENPDALATVYDASSATYHQFFRFTYLTDTVYLLNTLPNTNNTYTLGSSSNYWQYIYGSRHYFNSTANIDGGTAGLMTLTGQLKFAAGTTGSGSAALGANSPAVTNTAPYTWLQVTASDGSQLYVPAWK